MALKNPITRIIKEYTGVALSTKVQTKQNVIIQPFGAVTGIDIDLKVTAAGTLTTAKNVLNAINKLSLVTHAGKVLMNVDGTELDKILQLYSSNGSYVTPDTVVDATEKYFKGLLNIPIANDDMPCTIAVSFNPYSELASAGCTGADVDLSFRAWYGNVENTLLLHKRSLALIVGDNVLGGDLTNLKDTVKMAFVVGSESNITSLTFSDDGAKDLYANMPLQQLINLEKQAYKDGHQTGLFNLFVTPFKVNTSLTKLDVLASGTDTLDVYQVALN